MQKLTIKEIGEFIQPDFRIYTKLSYPKDLVCVEDMDGMILYQFPFEKFPLKKLINRLSEDLSQTHSKYITVSYYRRRKNQKELYDKLAKFTRFEKIEELLK